MVRQRFTDGLGVAVEFSTAALRYWCDVYPQVCREIRYWRERAEQIPDPVLRRLALEAHAAKRGNVEGAAAFAAFAPRAIRRLVVCAQVAFQMVYDYADTLAEQPHDDPVLNGGQIHQALRVALDPQATHLDYYRHLANHDDARYLPDIVDSCRYVTERLPSYSAVQASIRRLCERIIRYQSLNLTVQQGGHEALRRWATGATPRGVEMRWWETAASAGSSLGVFSLLTTASAPGIDDATARAIESAYFPWVGALHSLLDSLADEAEDRAAGIHSLLGYYASGREATARLTHLAEQAVGLVEGLPRASEHRMILAAMVSHYLSDPRMHSRHVEPSYVGVLKASGTVEIPTMLIMRARYALAGRYTNG